MAPKFAKSFTVKPREVRVIKEIRFFTAAPVRWQTFQGELVGIHFHCKMFVRNFLILLTVACCPRARAAYVSLQRRAPQSVCYGELGCFHASGQLPVPQSPSAIGTMFELYRPGQYFNFPAMNFKSRIGAWISHFDSTKGTKVVIHGYLDDGHKAWIRKIIGELHKKV